MGQFELGWKTMSLTLIVKDHRGGHVGRKYGWQGRRWILIITYVTTMNERFGRCFWQMVDARRHGQEEKMKGSGKEMKRLRVDRGWDR